MIVSHEHRFIFLKTRKTAGTSIEVFLERLAGSDAIVSAIRPAVAGHTPRNHDVRFNPLPQMVRTRKVRETLRERGKRPTFYNHMGAALIRERLGRQRWNSYFKFCFEREPWDKVVSAYYFRTRRAPEPFRAYVLERKLPSDFDLYSLDGEVAVDFVGRYENLEADLTTALAQVGLGTTIELPRAKANLRPAAATIHELFTPELDARVAHVFRREIRAFGYVDRSRVPE